MKGLKYNQFPLRTKCPNIFCQSNEIVLDAFAFDCKNIFFMNMPWHVFHLE